MKPLLALLLAFFVLLGAPAQAADGDWDPALMHEQVGMEPFGQPITDEAEVERIAHEISAGLRCPVCQGMSVADSSTEAALNMKARVADLVTQGYTAEQIEDFFVVRYSTWILLEPPKEGLNWLVWAGPLGLAALGFVGVLLFWLRRRSGGPEAAPEQVESTEDPYEKRILEELNR